MYIKSVKMKILKNKKKCVFFSCPKDHSTQKSDSQVKRCALQPGYRQTDTKVTTVGTLSGFQEFFLQPIIKDRPNSFQTLGGKIWPLVLNQPVTFVPGSVRCSSALCWFHFSLFFFGHHKIIKELQCLQRYRRHMM